MRESLISIIIPTYNRLELLKETINSIQNQNYIQWECIVVDDGSTDQTLTYLNKIAKIDSRIKYFKRPSGLMKGGNAARNYGFSKSKGEFILWFDSDDIMLNNYLETILEVFKNINIDIVICESYSVDVQLQNYKHTTLTNTNQLFKDYVLWKLHFVTGAVIFRSSFLINKKLFNENLLRGQENEFFSRIFFKLPLNKFSIIHTPLFLYRRHADSKTSKDKSLYISEFSKSFAYAYTQNLYRANEIEDRELLNYLYRFLRQIFLRSLRNKDKKNAKYTLNGFLPIVRVHSFWAWLKLLLFGNIFLLFNRSFYIFEKFFKNYRF